MNRNNRRQPKKREHKINGEVRFKEVRLVGGNVEGGVMSSYDASKIADEMELDLVLINDKADIPIVKIMDYDKFIYERDKNKKNTRPLPLKEIKMGPNISDHDLETKEKQVKKFLDKGHKVKTVVEFRGRQMAHQDLGMKVLMRLAQDVQDHGVPEALPNKVVGRKLIMFLKPKK
jgi:translation initiation factor IF-3